MFDISINKKLNAASGEMHLAFSCQIEQGQLVTLYGKSGVGKTSILRILAGLMEPDEAYISAGHKIWVDTKKNINLKPQKRKIGFVFQDYALFPNMTIKENLTFALVKNQDKKIIGELIDIMELGELQHRKPTTLSGGQKQRVALARALVQRPVLLMLDEPLSALDHEMRGKLQQHILQAHREYGLTTLLVTHDISEIIKMSNQVIVLEEGKISQHGTPAQIFSHQKVGGKFQFSGEIVSLEKQGFIYLITIIIGKELVTIMADESDGATLQVGDKVTVASKAFNPIIKKM
ncbi:MAG: ATP-binding cassette domain-containing protein [Bacteroidota bacterium]